MHQKCLVMIAQNFMKHAFFWWKVKLCSETLNDATYMHIFEPKIPYGEESLDTKDCKRDVMFNFRTNNSNFLPIIHLFLNLL